MPKVTDEHRTARREQILQAAWRSFSVNGFHATSMADVIRESGLSAGAVYGYFASKEELIKAAATATMGQVSEIAITQLANLEPPAPAEAVALVLERLIGTLNSDGLDRAPLALHAFSEATRSPDLMLVMRATHLRVRAAFVEVARRAVEAGLLAADADPELVGAAMFGLLPGYIVQHQTTGIELADYLDGVRSMFGASG